VQFVEIMRDQLAGSGMLPSTYVDSGGLNPRADIAGLHLAQFPSVLGARRHEERVRPGACGRIGCGRGLASICDCCRDRRAGCSRRGRAAASRELSVHP
jgi:hypothetical protein